MSRHPLAWSAQGNTVASRAWREQLAAARAAAGRSPADLAAPSKTDLREMLRQAAANTAQKQQSKETA